MINDRYGTAPTRSITLDIVSNHPLRVTRKRKSCSPEKGRRKHSSGVGSKKVWQRVFRVSVCDRHPITIRHGRGRQNIKVRKESFAGFRYAISADANECDEIPTRQWTTTRPTSNAITELITIPTVARIGITTLPALASAIAIGGQYLYLFPICSEKGAKNDELGWLQGLRAKAQAQIDRQSNL
ncbi:hypothetical protein ZHAS_00007287 [Anopheles sinensis]|uniref:Uncharacterized protein n=1 Tax=Anopheles sinensis TaxID=74873 RepID=A0A084VPL4_ANOSI|nr:hypothetical protein ZHAS_00007287 [Anopheles sinensis]